MLNNKIAIFSVLGWVALAIGLVSGQLVQIPVPIIGTVLLLDFIVTLLGLWGLCIAVDFFINKHKSPPLFFWFAALFVLVAVLSLLGSTSFLGLGDVFKSSQFLIRWILYAALALWAFVSSKYLKATIFKNGANIIIISILILVLLGFVQVIFFPDLGFWEKFGWDPHQNRLASTFLDPNLLGGVLLFGLAISFGGWRQNKTYNWALISGIILLALLFTYSRSALVGLIALLISFGIKEWKALILVLIMFASIYVISPRLQERISGVFDLDVTARYRIESLYQGWEMLKDNPLLGVGYNTIQYSRSEYFYQPNSNSSTGFDSSLMTIAVTTGWLGLVAYTGLLLSVLYLAWKRFKQTIYKDGLSLSLFIGTIALLAQSWFVNNLLYASIMAIWWITIGLVWKEYNDDLV